ncbi:MAG: hypothetical protein MUF58_02920 [Arcicella sp.]|jgi:hypothetical protein|nr:hypothetical protein [Arcicella sp.]
MNSAPKELSEDDFKKLQGQYQAQYGINMNKQVVLLFEMQKAAHLQEINLIQSLYQQQKQENATMHQKQMELLNQKTNQDKQQHEKYIEGIDKAVLAIGKQKGAIITDNPKVVLQHNLSKYGIICSFLLLCVGAFFYAFYYKPLEKYKKEANLSIQYPAIVNYKILAKEGEIQVSPNGRKFLVLTLPQKGAKALAGKNYEYDQKKKRILVPLNANK